MSEFQAIIIQSSIFLFVGIVMMIIYIIDKMESKL